MSNDVSIRISIDEWRQLARWMIFCIHPDERDARGHFYLECRGVERTWITAGGGQWTVFHCSGPAVSRNGDSEEPLRILVSPRFFQMIDPQDADLVVEEIGGKKYQTMCGDNFEFTVEAHPDVPPDWRELFEPLSGEVVRVNVRDLMLACRSVNAFPHGGEGSGDAPIPAWLYTLNGNVCLRAPWVEYADSLVRIGSENKVADSVPALFSLDQLTRLLLGVEGDEVDLYLPPHRLGAVGLSSGNFTAALFPIDQWAHERRRLEQLLCSYLNLESVVRDDDGDYPIRTADDIDYWVRLHTDTVPLTVQVFSVLARDVECSHDLLKELNEINASAAHVKVLWFEGSVMAEVDLVAHELDMSEFANAMTVVMETTRKYLPVLGPFFGRSDAD